MEVAINVVFKEVEFKLLCRMSSFEESFAILELFFPGMKTVITRALMLFTWLHLHYLIQSDFKPWQK